MNLLNGAFLARVVPVGAILLSSQMGLAADAPPPVLSRTVLSVPAVAVSEVAPLPVAADVVASTDLRQIECVAKVVRHEAANQPVEGQIAVAHVILARMRDGRFPATACDVVNQPGQFFNVDAYDPPRRDARWTTALRIATDALSGGDVENGPAAGALFFHSDGVRMRGRTVVATIADHTFYR